MQRDCSYGVHHEYNDIVQKVTLTYHANGGSNAPAAQTVDKGANVTIKGQGSMTRPGYEFKGWNTKSDATTADWAAGDTMRLNANTDLYAVWKKTGPTDNGNGISITKTRTSAATAERGEEITWNITVTNRSNVEKTVTLTEKLTGAYFTETNTGIQTVTLAPAGQDGSSKTVTATYTVKNSNKGTIVNTVEATTDNPNDEKKEASDDGTRIVADYTVKWQDTDGNKLAEPETRNGTVGTTVNANSNDKKLIDGYTYNEDLSTTSAEVKANGSTELILVYTKNPEQVNTKIIPFTPTVVFQVNGENATQLTKEQIAQNYSITFTYTDMDGDHVVTLTPSSTGAQWNTNDADYLTITWPKWDVKIKDVSGEKIDMTVTQSNYRIGNDDEVIYEKTYTTDGKYQTDGTGVVTVSRASSGLKATTVNHYKQPVTPPEPETPNLKIEKLALVNGTVKPGDEVKYMITVTNLGDTEVKNVVITDVLDTNLEFVSAAGSGSVKTWSSEPENGLYVVGNLSKSGVQSKDFATVTITAKVKDNAPTGIISNTATADCDDMPKDDKPSDTATVNVTNPGEPETVTVTFIDGYDGTEIPNSKITDWTKGEVVPTDRYPTRPTHEDKDPNGWKVETNADGNITITALWKDKTTEPETEKVTITVNFVDGEKVVKTVTETVDKDSDYDVTAETGRIPEGYVADGDPTGDELAGTADVDKVINVPVKKTPVEPAEKVTVTVEFVDEDGNAVKTVTEKVDKGSEYDKTEEVENIPEGYEANGVVEGDVYGTADDDVVITVPVKQSNPDDPKPNQVTITIEFVDEDGDVVKTVTEQVNQGSEYDKTDEVTNIPDGYVVNDELEVEGNVYGTADDDVIITVPVKKTPVEPVEEVTVTVKFVDEDGNEVKVVTETVEKGSEYDKTDEITNFPKGYEANGDPTGDPITGAADNDVTITVPVKKSGGEGPDEPETKYTVTWKDGDIVIGTGETKDPENLPTYPAVPTAPEGKEFDKWGEPVVDEENKTITIQIVWKDKTTEPEQPETYTVTYVLNGGTSSETLVYTGLERGVNTPRIANPTRDGYTFAGWSPEVAATVTGNAAYTAQWTSNGGGNGGGGGGTNIPDTNPPTTDPGTDIGDENPPLANVDDKLNTTDHFAYIIGYPEGDVRPNANITRAEAVTIFFRLMTDEFRAANWSSENAYPDVESGDWFNNAISTLTKAGIFKGDETGNARPNDAITRAEFAALAARFMSDEIVDDGARFEDTEGHWAAADIRRAMLAGWIKGVGGNKFEPDRNITRAEVMTLVNRMLDRVADKDHMLSDMKVWSDNMDTSAWYYADVQEATNGHDYKRLEGELTEQWTALQEARDWAALETEWATAESGK